MGIEFDPAKNAANLAKHKLPLSFGARVLAHLICEQIDARFEYVEERVMAFGLVDGRLFVCVYTMRGDVARIISVRKATKGEGKQWLS